MTRILALFATLLFALPAAAQQATERQWVQLQALRSAGDAIRAAEGFGDAVPRLGVYAAAGGWTVVSAGPFTARRADRLRRRLLRTGVIPGDAFITDGAAYREALWPAGATLAAPAPVAEPEPEPESQIEGEPQVEIAQADAATTPQADGPAEPEAVPEPAPEETLREARASEAALSSQERFDIQTALQWAGVYSAGIDGAFGRGTRRAMRDWQAMKGFEATGVLTTRQRAQLFAEYNAILDGLDMAYVADEVAGIQIAMPTAAVELDSHTSPFARYEPKTEELPARVLLISQPGTRETLGGLYEIMQTLEIVPSEGPRERSADQFELEGTDARIASYTYAEHRDGVIKGFTLIWPAGDEERRTRVLDEMKASFARLPGVMDPSTAPEGVDQNVDLVSGLAIRRPDRSATGFYVDARGRVLTSARAVEGCGRVTVDHETDARVSHVDEDLGLAVLVPEAALSPLGFARFRADVPRLQDRVAVAGFPFGGALTAPTLAFGRLDDVRALDGDEGRWRLGLRAREGQVGGPVLDERGDVVAVLAPRQAPDGMILPADVAFAVPARDVMDALRVANVPLMRARTGGRSLEPESLALLADDMTVLVSCWN
ncbi:MAG: serine protease [Paracoccaceae bacterium]